MYHITQYDSRKQRNVISEYNENKIVPPTKPLEIGSDVYMTIKEMFTSITIFVEI